MSWEVAGLGNALMDALVVLEDDALIDELGLVRGTMHLVDHQRWQEVYERVRLHDVTFDSGGSCANTIATVGRLGGRALYCGQVGDDQMGRLYASLIEKACGDHAVRFGGTANTGKCLSIISAADAERTMLTDLGASVTLPELGRFAHELREARVAHFTGYTLLDGPMRQVVLEAMELASSAGATISLDAADPFVVVQIRETLWSVVRRYTDVLFLNAEEARALVDHDDPEVACRTIADEGDVSTVVVKLGSRGSLLLHEGELHRVAVHTIDAVDTTGAGDAYAGGYLYGMTRGWSPSRCGQLASHVAALTVSQIGAVVKDPTKLAAAVDRARDAAA
jgi:sugar/nucleoside kinase (ribokinase family)